MLHHKINSRMQGPGRDSGFRFLNFLRFLFFDTTSCKKNFAPRLFYLGDAPNPRAIPDFRLRDQVFKKLKYFF